MGASLYVVLEREIPGFDPTMDGKALSRAEPRLTQLCRRLGVKDLYEFYSDNPLDLAYLFDDGESLDDEPTATDRGKHDSERWFSAEEGLTTVRALQRELPAEPPEDPWHPHLLEDLKTMEIILDRAAQEGIGWHLAVDF